MVKVNHLASHRGPDGEGYWLFDGGQPAGEWFSGPEISSNPQKKGRIGLGHSRLSIIDLSDAGLQPMPSETKQQWIVYNGEVYNYLELKDELIKAGHHFRTNTDTEVILAAYNEWGTACFNHFNGMWGLAIIDLEKRILVLSRDRMGVKPLYYWFNGIEFAFVSEIKQFLGFPNFIPAANYDVVLEYIETGYEIPPETFFQNVKAFPPASYAEISLDEPEELQAKRFWIIEDISPGKQSLLDAEEQLRFLFNDAVRLRLRSDVPVGVCLSGGLDSSIIFSQIRDLLGNDKPLHAFSAAYHEKQFDESPYVRLVLERHGGQAHYVFPDAATFIEDFDAFIYQHDEPPGGISQYAAWAVMRQARENLVPVLLNGQGGDELFSGYWPAYFLYLRYELSRSPWEIASHLGGAILPNGNPQIIKEMPAHLRQYLVRRKSENKKILNGEFAFSHSKQRSNWAIDVQNLRPEHYRLGEITRIHLPRLLKWDDRNSMAFAIEGRYPFLDYRIVEYALRLPVRMNLHSGWNKYMLRKSFGQMLPEAIQWRRSKVGFVTPQSIWMQTSLKPVFLEWAQAPSHALSHLVDRKSLLQFSQHLLSSKSIHPMNEDQHLLFRFFALDKWLNIFNVSI